MYNLNHDRFKSIFKLFFNIWGLIKFLHNGQMSIPLIMRTRVTQVYPHATTLPVSWVVKMVWVCCGKAGIQCAREQVKVL